MGILKMLHPHIQLDKALHIKYKNSINKFCYRLVVCDFG